MQNLASCSLVSTTLCDLATDSLAINCTLNKFGFPYSWGTGSVSYLMWSPCPQCLTECLMPHGDLLIELSQSQREKVLGFGARMRYNLNENDME